MRLKGPPPVDPADRALFVDRVLSGSVTLDGYKSGAFPAVASWSRDRCDVAIDATDDAVELALRVGAMEKRIRFTPSGQLTVTYRWDPTAFPPDAFFCPEISVARELALDLEPLPSGVWSFPFATVSRSESGFEETVQGHSYTPRWPVRAGQGKVIVRL